MSGKNVYVHVLLERLRDACRGRCFEDLAALNEGIDAILARYGSCWRKPSIDEALLGGEPPWHQAGKAGSPLDWGASLRGAISVELGLSASVGIAASEVAARICSRLARPRGVLVWMPGRERGLLGGIPLEELDEIRPEQIARLRSKGIGTLDALAALTPSEACSILGCEGERLVGRVRGDDPDVGPENGTRPDALARLASRLSGQLERRRFLACGLELAVEYADGIRRERHTRLHRATSASGDLEEAASRLFRVLRRSAEPVVGLSLTATGLRSTEQPGLFGPTGAREVRVAMGRANHDGAVN
jgi:nucleotidyltransferase/DNA polymerase involved in DNA repair